MAVAFGATCLAAAVAWLAPPDGGGRGQTGDSWLTWALGTLTSSPEEVERRVSWTSTMITSDKAESLASQAVDWLTLSAEDRDLWSEFDVWSETLAGRDAFGRGVASCVLEHEQNLEAPCAWDHLIVVQKGKWKSKVVHVTTLFRSSKEADDQRCRAYAECIRDQWHYRVGPAIPDAKREHVAIRALGIPATAAWLRSGKEYFSYYESFLRELNDDVERRKRGSGELTSESAAATHNRRQDAALREHTLAVMAGLGSQ